MTNEELATLSPGDVLEHKLRLYGSTTYWIIIEHEADTMRRGALLECVYDEDTSNIGRFWNVNAPGLLTLYARGTAND